MTEVDFAASLSDYGLLNQITISVSADDSSHPADTPLASEVLTDQLDVSPAVLHWTPAMEPVLNEGETYWITLEAVPGNVVWNYNYLMQAGDSRLISGVWTSEPGDTQGALQIFGVHTPEPGTGLLLGGTLSALAVLLKKRPGLRR